MSARNCGVFLAVGLLAAVAGCNGTAVVTLTASAAQNTFLAYRVGLVSVQLQSADGITTSQTLPNSTTVDLAKLTRFSEVLGVVSVAKTRYTGAMITLDYTSAVIVYDDGSVNGVALTPLAATGRALGRVNLLVTLDPNGAFGISLGQVSRLALDFKIAASNGVDLAQRTVTVTPLIVASANPIDAKAVRIRGPLLSVDGVHSLFTMAVTPFDFAPAGAGQLEVGANALTTYTLDGVAYAGPAGLAQLARAGTGPVTEAFGSLASANGASSAANVSFSAGQVFAGSTLQGSGFDRVSGIVSARSGNSLTLTAATLVTVDGINRFIAGAATVTVGSATRVSRFAAGGVAGNAAQPSSTQQISVGSAIDAFGTLSTPVSANVTLDAGAGRVRLGNTQASALVSAQGLGTLTLNLDALGGRSAAAFDFRGTGAPGGVDARPSAYTVNTGALDLSKATPGVPVQVSGLASPFGTSPPDFSAATLLDPAMIQAELVMDWGAGTTLPFRNIDSSAIDVDVHNPSIASRHQIRVGAQSIDILGLAADPVLLADGTASATIFAIGHTASATVENFNSYARFIAALRTQLNGTARALCVTALGKYTASNLSFSATSITLSLDN